MPRGSEPRDTSGYWRPAGRTCRSHPPEASETGVGVCTDAPRRAAGNARTSVWSSPLTILALRVETTWRELTAFLPNAPGRWEAIIVCDGCSDGSAEELQRLARGCAQVRVLSYAPNRGKGYAVRHGLLAARGAQRIFADIDLAYGFEDILRLARVLEGGADVAIASRTHPDSRVTLPVSLQGYIYRRHLQSLVFGALARWLLPLTQHDLQAGLKGFSARATELILPHIRCEGFGFDCELLTACVRNGLSIIEVPVHVRYEDEVSTTSLRTVGRMVQDLLRIRRAWRHESTAPAAAPVAGRRDAA